MPLRKIVVENLRYGTKNCPNHDSLTSFQPRSATKSPLCDSCWEFLNGSPQRTTDEDLGWFQNLLEAEHEGGFIANATNVTDDRTSPVDCFRVTELKSLLTAARERSCHLCVLVRDRFIRDNECGQLFQTLEERHLKGDAIEYKVRIAIERNYDVGSFPYRVRVDFTLPETAQQAFISLNIASGQGLDWEEADMPLSSSTSSRESLDMASHWLSTCLNTHDGCKPLLRSRNTVLPARLIDTKGVDETGLVAIHMVSPSEEPYQYMALSHCWGNKDRLLLTSENQSELEAGVQLDRLALNFQHAVQITRHLGCRYLWIDCLCIQQDSREDWTAEASKMGSIYGNAICCIAASASNDSDGGCFRDREPFLVQPLRIEKHLFPNLQIFSASNSFMIVKDSAELVWAAYGEGPLEKRGWILQEHVLAPRTLHFTETQIFWECRRRTASEAWPSKVFEQTTSAQPLAGTIKATFDLSRRFAREQWMSPAITDSQRLYRRWTDLVEEYTQRLLTFQQDRLPAMSGLADVMGSVTGDDYIAGIWRKDLLRGLAWYTWTLRAADTRSHSHRTPTWSWASVPNAVRCHLSVDQVRDIECTIHEVKTDLLDDSPTGRVKEGKLTVTGLFRPSSWKKERTSMNFMRCTEEHGPNWMRMTHDNKDVGDQSSVYLLQLFQSYLFSDGLTHLTRFVGGLVLTPTNRPDEYQRVGYMESTMRFEYNPNESSREKILQDISVNTQWRHFREGWVLKKISIV